MTELFYMRALVITIILNEQGNNQCQDRRVPARRLLQVRFDLGAPAQATKLGDQTSAPIEGLAFANPVFALAQHFDKQFRFHITHSRRLCKLGLRDSFTVSPHLQYSVRTIYYCVHL